jgi:hypothetical protein
MALAVTKLYDIWFISEPRNDLGVTTISQIKS